MSVSVFGLIVPAMEEPGVAFEKIPWLPVILGFLLGSIMLYALDKVFPHMHLNKEEYEEGPKTKNINKHFKFFVAVTMHNIPEGIATGLACSLAVLHKEDPTYMYSALSLAIAIAIQNFPEGAAVSIPLLQDGVKKGKSFTLGFLSGVVEPIFAVIAFFLATSIGNSIMPWLLSFAGGAMIYVTVDDLIPDIKNGDNTHFGIWSFIIGFMLMMLMEVVL